jgi:2-polyprenyl-6-hydroxyphenyl methylase/3-demethylubiquinone-9 3-methyltransferase
MNGYYKKKLAGERLLACYEIAPPRVKAYLESEIDFVLERTTAAQTVLELGCGYGRVLKRIAERAGMVYGIDTSLESLCFARGFLPEMRKVRLLLMDAARMGFSDRRFDLTFCVQNGISAFAVDREKLFGEALRVTRPGGTVLFSTYSPRFWSERLEWFEIQSAYGLLGEIDREGTRDGVIVCKDGFRATTVDAEEFRSLAVGRGVAPRMVEVSDSSLFCEFTVP